MRAHPVRLGAHREGQAAGAGQFRVVALLQYRLAGLGTPDQAVEQVEAARIARLDRLGGERHQGAGHAEAAAALGRRIGGRAADRPGDGLGWGAGEHVRPCGGAPAVPVGLACEHDAGHAMMDLISVFDPRRDCLGRTPQHQPSPDSSHCRGMMAKGCWRRALSCPKVPWGAASTEPAPARM